MIIIQLNSDLKKRIADYLCASDAIWFSQTCKSIHHDLDFQTMIDVYSYSRYLTREHHWRPTDYHEGDTERIWFRLFPIVLKNPIHTIRFTCYVRDQGWGNRKGKLYIRQDKNENNYKGDIIAESPLVDHEDRDISFQFSPEPGMKYTMCYVIGGGGGHELYVRDPEVQILYYHNRGIVDAANMLRKKDIAPIRESKFGLKLLIGAVERLIQDNKSGLKMPKDDALADSLAHVGLDPYNIDQLNAMMKFLASLEAFRNPRRKR